MSHMVCMFNSSLSSARARQHALASTPHTTSTTCTNLLVRRINAKVWSRVWVRKGLHNAVPSEVVCVRVCVCVPVCACMW